MSCRLKSGGIGRRYESAALKILRRGGGARGEFKRDTAVQAAKQLGNH